jgi:hypothetical protein
MPSKIVSATEEVHFNFFSINKNHAIISQETNDSTVAKLYINILKEPSLNFRNPNFKS